MAIKGRFFVLLLLALAGGATYYQVLEKQPAAKAEKGKGGGAVPVLAERAQVADLPVRLTLVGRAEAVESVTLRARVDGQVAEVAFVAGQPVKKGDLLLRLDKADFEAKVRQAEANIARDRAELARAKADLVRYTSAKEFVAGEKLAEVRANADVAEAALRTDEAALELARMQLGYTAIHAPFEGVAGDRLIHLGALVKTNDTDLVRINRMDPIFVGFAVPETHLPTLRQALAGEGLRIVATVPGDDGPPLEGPVSFLDNAVETTTGTIRLKALLANPGRRLSPGQFVQVGLVLKTLHDAVTIPEEAVQQGPKGAFVFIVKDDGVEQRPVKVRHVQDRRAAVEGVAEGEQAVTEGHVRLTPGAKVQVKQ